MLRIEKLKNFQKSLLDLIKILMLYRVQKKVNHDSEQIDLKIFHLKT